MKINTQKRQWKPAIIGYGKLGKTLHSFFLSRNPEITTKIVVYDVKPSPLIKSKDKINQCDIAFICVDTPSQKDGSCDISRVENVLKWLVVPLIVIRSTIPPGTTDYLKNKYQKRIVFEPEYKGETPQHPYYDLLEKDFIILGGEKGDIKDVISFYQNFHNATLKIYQCSSIEAEVTKYFVNMAIANKVTFCNEFYEICSVFKLDYNKVRELFLADFRFSRWFTFVYPEKRGWNSKCLNKDITAIIKACEKAGYDPHFLKFVVKSNQKHRKNTS